MTQSPNESAQSPGAHPLLRHIAAGTAYATGHDFLKELVRTAAGVLNVRHAFVAEFLESATRARVLAWWNGETYCDIPDYPLAGTPCETVLNGEIRHYPRGVQTLFPADHDLVNLGVESYLAIPLLSRDNEVLGHMAILDTAPMQAGPREFDVLKIFGARACAELERKRYEEALAASEDRVSRVLDSALDAIITMDGERRITLFNPAAERIFGCAAGWAVGQPFDRFLSKPFRSLMDGYLQAADAEGEGAQPLWAPQGLTALRAKGEEFPVEGTVSAFLSAQGEKLYSLILRDVNERERTQAELRRLGEQNVFLQEEIKGRYKFEDMVGRTAVMRRLFETLKHVGQTDSTVLVYGETGTGKEQVAHALHNLSARRERLLVKLNCAALPSELIESEMFGHEKGAFTGATAQRKGRFEMADGGTLFLDEVGELSAAAQAKLLRVLQEQEFERVGGTRSIRVDVRVIAATNRNLEEMVQAGSFRADLYYRLNVFPVQVPALRERVEDIPLLVEHFLGVYARKLGKKLAGVEEESLRRLQRYGWPGNIRELQNVIERAAVLASGPLLVIRDALDAGVASTAAADTGLCTLEEVEAAHIRGVMQQADWKIEGKNGAAAILGLEPSTLCYRMQKLGIKRPSAGRADS